MDVRDQICYLLREYLLGKYVTRDFCDALCAIFYPDIPEGLRELERLAYAASRFSPRIEDHIACPNAYTTENEIKRIATEVAERLEICIVEGKRRDSVCRKRSNNA